MIRAGSGSTPAAVRFAAAAGGVMSFLRFMAPVAAAAVCWELATRAGLVDASILPPPSMVLARGLELLAADANHVLVGHILVSLYRALIAFMIAAAIAVPLGFWLGLSPGAYAWIGPILSLLLPLPAVAWTPIFLVALGQGDVTIILVCVLGAFFPVLYSTIQAVQGIPKQSTWVVRSMGAGRLRIFRSVLLPASLPTVMTGFKLGLAHSWRTLVAAEMLAALDHGLGFMIFAAREYMDVRTMFVGIVLLAALGFLFEHAVFGTVERATIRKWYRDRQRRT